MRIKYESVTGEVIEIAVEDKIVNDVIQIEKDQYNSDHRETRRHNSIEKMREQGVQIADDHFDIVAQVEAAATKEAVHNALVALLPQQRELVNKVFFKEMSIAEIARVEEVGESAIRDRLNRIYKKLKKILD